MRQDCGWHAHSKAFKDPMENEIVSKSFKDSVKTKEKFLTKKNSALIVQSAEAIV